MLFTSKDRHTTPFFFHICSLITNVNTQLAVFYSPCQVLQKNEVEQDWMKMQRFLLTIPYPENNFPGDLFSLAFSKYFYRNILSSPDVLIKVFRK